MKEKELTQEQINSILTESVLKLYGHIEIRTKRDQELIDILYELKRNDRK
jgi:hypothetical protein